LDDYSCPRFPVPSYARLCAQLCYNDKEFLATTTKKNVVVINAVVLKMTERLALEARLGRKDGPMYYLSLVVTRSRPSFRSSGNFLICFFVRISICCLILVCQCSLLVSLLHTAHLDMYRYQCIDLQYVSTAHGRSRVYAS
jgi:hypothetical protein